MIDDKIIYKVLLYVALASIVYMLCRYLPFTEFSVLQSVNIAIILVLVVVLCDILITKFILNANCDTSTLLDDLTSSKPTCKSCGPTSAPETFTSGNQKCRIVCDSTEPMTNITKQPEITNPDATAANNPYVNKTCTWLSSNDKMTISKDNQYGYNSEFQMGHPNYQQMREDPVGELNDARIREQHEKQYVDTTKAQLEDRAKNLAGYDCAYQSVGSKSKLNYVEKGRSISGDIDNELIYSDYNHLPVAAGYKSHDYEYGWSFLPPEKWYPQPPRPPICVTEKRCPVMPVYTQGAPMDVKEFHHSNRILPPDMINIEYIKDKLNDGY